jgi:AcrR family transcriptional regulator
VRLAAPAGLRLRAAAAPVRGPSDDRRLAPDRSLAVRERLLEAAYACIARAGLAKTTVEDVARQSGLSRASVYRTFPGGRDELIREVVSWQIGVFFADLASAVADADGFEEVVERALLQAHKQVGEHEVLQHLLLTEPDRLLPTITMETSRFVPLIAAFAEPYLARERLRPGIDRREAADYVARMVVSHIASPGRWDLTDAAQVQALVRAEILAGIVSSD